MIVVVLGLVLYFVLFSVGYLVYIKNKIKLKKFGPPRVRTQVLGSKVYRLNRCAWIVIAFGLVCYLLLFSYSAVR